jgi:hypothetical protein
MPVPDTIERDEELEEVSRIGEAIYNERLRSFLEPQYNGQYVAVHLDTGDYEVGRGTSKPHFALRARHPDGMIMVRFIGIATDEDVPDRILEHDRLVGLRK